MLNQQFFILLSLIGVIFISRSENEQNSSSSFDYSTLFGILLGLTRVILASLSIVYTRALGNRVHSMLPIFLDSIVTVSVFIPLFLVLDWTPISYYNSMNINDFYCLLGIAIANVVGGTFGKISLEYEKSAIACIFFNTRIIFSYIWQWAILGNEPVWQALVGASLIFGSAVAINFQ